MPGLKARPGYSSAVTEEGQTEGGMLIPSYRYALEIPVSPLDQCVPYLGFTKKVAIRDKLHHKKQGHILWLDWLVH